MNVNLTKLRKSVREFQKPTQGAAFALESWDWYLPTYMAEIY